MHLLEGKHDCAPECVRSQEAVVLYCCVRFFRRCSTLQRRCPSFHSRTPSTVMARSSSTMGGLEQDLLKVTVVMLTVDFSTARCCCGPTSLQACESSSCSSTQSARVQLAQPAVRTSHCMLLSFYTCAHQCKCAPRWPKHDSIHHRRFCCWQANMQATRRCAAQENTQGSTLRIQRGGDISWAAVTRCFANSWIPGMPEVETPLGWEGQGRTHGNHEHDAGRC